MPKLTGVFEQFIDLDKIPTEDINKWLKNKVEVHALKNFIANLVQYPQTVPVKKEDLEIELAILQEVVQKKPELFVDAKNNRLVVPGEFVDRFPPLPRLIKLFVQTLKLSPSTQIFLKINKHLQYLATADSLEKIT